jgi:hypothetical protein
MERQVGAALEAMDDMGCLCGAGKETMQDSSSCWAVATCAAKWRPEGEKRVSEVEPTRQTGTQSGWGWLRARRSGGRKGEKRVSEVEPTRQTGTQPKRAGMGWAPVPCRRGALGPVGRGRAAHPILALRYRCMRHPPGHPAVMT